MQMMNLVVICLSEELDIDYDDEINLEIEGETASEELSTEMAESQREK